MAGIRIELELEDGSFTTRMMHAGETVQQFNDNVSQMYTRVSHITDGTQRLMTTLRDMTIILGLARDAFETLREVTVGWAYDIVKVNAEMESMTQLLRGMSKASDPLKEAANQVKYLRDYAKEAPFSLKALSDTFVKMKATGIDPTNGALKATVDAVAAIGGSDEALKRVGIALTQMSGKGVIQMEELRQQLGEAVPRAVELMARSVGLSMSELIAQVSKGTVESKSTLAAFFLELERTFGGAAQQQMQTFNGMLSQTKTILQNLALTVGENGFFDIIKKQMKDFNQLLTSSAGQASAESLGRGLTTVTGVIRDALNWMIEFHNEIIRVGEVLALGFGVKIAMGALTSLISVLSMIVTEFRALGAAAYAANLTITLAQLGARAGEMGIAGIGISRFTAALVSARAAFGFLAVAAGTVASVILPLGLMIVSVAAYFGLFSNKAKDAYEDLKRFGAQSREEVEKAKPFLEALEKELDTLRKISEEKNKAPRIGRLGSVRPVELEGGEEALNSKNAKVEETRKVLAAAAIEGTKKDIEKMVKVTIDGIDEQISALQKGYDERLTERGRFHEDEMKRLQTDHRDIQKEHDAFQAEQREAELKLYDDELAVIDSFIDAEKFKRASGYVEALANAEAFDRVMFARRNQIASARNAQADMALGVTNIAKPDNLEALLKKAGDEIDKLKAGIQGNKLELAGFNGEWGKLVYLMEEASRAKYGPIDNPTVRQSINLIKEFAAEYERTSEIVTGQTKLDRELERLFVNEQQRALELATRGKNALDKLNVAVEMGLYGGQKPITLMERGFIGIGDAAKTAGTIMKQAFGGEVLEAGQTLLGVVQNIGQAFTGVGKKKAAGGNALSNLYNDDKGSIDAGSLLSRFKRAESGDNPNAQSDTSSALGPMQFIKSTWMDFLKEMHPDLLKSMSEDQALDLRRNPSMSNEAGGWYMQKNATAFGMRGVEQNDANLYLGHLLGTGGALAALTRTQDTLVALIPELSAAIKSNPNVFKNINTVGDLQSWARGKVGSGTTTQEPYQPINKNDAATNIPTSFTPKQVSMEDAARRLAQKNNTTENVNAIEDEKQKIIASIKEIGDAQDGLTKKTAAYRKMIELGKFGPELNPDAERYKELLKFADDQDKAETIAADRKANRSKLQSEIESTARNKEVLADKQAEMARRYESEQTFKFSGEIFRQESEMKKKQESNAEGVRLGNLSQQDANAQNAELARQFQQHKNLEITAYIQTEQEKIKAVERSLMSQDDAREASFKDDVARMKNALSLFKGTEEERAKYEAVIQRKISAEQSQKIIQAPIGKQLKEWGDLSDNLQKSVTNWMSSSVDHLQQLIMTGRTNWRMFSNEIVTDMAKIALKASFAAVLGPLMGVPSTGLGANSFGGGASKIGVAQHHMGGMVGSLPAIRKVDASMFFNAPRFHEGGYPGLAPGEVPIIAKQGEQVGWPEQLSKQYGGSSVSTVNNVSVHGSAGNQSQNQDLAERIVKQIGNSMDSRIDGRLRTQMRPNGMLSSR